MILDEIVEKKRQTVQKSKLKISAEELMEKLMDVPEPRNFARAVSAPGKLNIIAEMKRSSPSAGTILKDYSVRDIAYKYQEAGVAAISVLTEEAFFHGDLYHILQVKDNSGVPVLRKDFIIDEYQLIESRVFGADAVLLIAAILKRDELKALYKASRDMGLSAVVEVHNERELKEVMDIGPDIIGINNRDLDTLKVDIRTAETLSKKIRKDIIVIAESGYKDTEDIFRLSRTANINAVLIGEALLKQQNIREAARSLVKAGEKR